MASASWSSMTSTSATTFPLSPDNDSFVCSTTTQPSPSPNPDEICGVHSAHQLCNLQSHGTHDSSGWNIGAYRYMEGRILDSCRQLLFRRVGANRTWAKCYCIWHVRRLRFVQWRVLLPCFCVCSIVVYWNWISGNSYRSDIFFALIRLKWILIVAPVMILVVTMMLVLVIGIDYPLCAAVAWFPYSFQHVRIGL
jgi:hypothetical protein